MTTREELVERIYGQLHSYTGIHEQTTWLTAPIDADDLTLSVAAPDAVLRGIAEIEQELIYVHASDANTLTLAPFGRGYRASTAAAHAANTAVTFDPVFPRVEIRKALSEAIEGLHPTLYRVQYNEFEITSRTVAHDLPADADRVLRVDAALPDEVIYDNWRPYDSWSFDPRSTATGGPVPAVNLFYQLPIGTTVRVQYGSKFGTFTGDTAGQVLEDGGLTPNLFDLLTYAVTSRMVRFLDPARLNLASVENTSRAQMVQSGDAGKLANQLYAMYQSRLAEERRRLLETYPPQNNFLSR